MDINDEKHQESGDRPCSEIVMARELLSAASVTMKMAKHIRRLESKIHKLERKMNIDDSSSSDSHSDQDSDSKVYEKDMSSKSKDATKRHKSPDEPGCEEVHTQKKGKYQELTEAEQKEDSAVNITTSEQKTSQQARKFTREVIQVNAPLVTITPMKKLQEEENELTPKDTLSNTSCKNTVKIGKAGTLEGQQYTQEKEEVYQYCCCYCNAYVRQLPHTVRGEHLIHCATKHLRPPPSPNEITTLIQKTKLHEVRSNTIKPTTRVITGEENPVTSLKVMTAQVPAKSQPKGQPVILTQKPDIKTKPENCCTADIKKVQETASGLPSSASAEWKMKKELDFTCEDCGLVLAKAARLCHSQVCRKVISCLYCSKVFDTLDSLKKHKPQCKELNWDQHPVRLLQHEKQIPSSVFSLSTPSGKTTEIEESRDRGKDVKVEAGKTTKREVVVGTPKTDTDIKLNVDTVESRDSVRSKIKLDSNHDNTERVKMEKKAQHQARDHRKSKERVKPKGSATRKGTKRTCTSVREDEDDPQKDDTNDDVRISPVRHICIKCEKEFTARRFLVSHQIKCKKIPSYQDDRVKPDQQYIQETDSSKEQNEPNRKRALVFHLCVKCDHQFVSAKELREHQKNPTECEEWIKLKTRQKGLKASSRFCSGCKTNFATQHDYIQHRNSCVDAKTDQGTYNCFQCYMSFDTKEALNHHKQFAHSLNRNSNCWVCGETFSNFKEFLKHAEEHEDIKKRHPSRSRPCHVRDGHHLVLKKGGDPSILPPLPPEAIEAIANVMQGSQSKEALTTTRVDSDALTLQVKGSQPDQLETHLNPDALKIGGSQETENVADGSIKMIYRRNVVTQASIVDQPSSIAEDSGKRQNSPGYSKSVPLLLNTKPVTAVPLQKSAAGNDTEMVNKVTGLLHSLKSSNSTGETFQKLLSSHHINQPVQIKTNDPQLQKMISSLGSSQQIKLTGNRVGYVLKACKTESGFQLMNPGSSPSVNVTDLSSGVVHNLLQSGKEQPESKSQSPLIVDHKGNLKNLSLTPQHSTQNSTTLCTKDLLGAASSKTSTGTRKRQLASKDSPSKRKGSLHRKINDKVSQSSEATSCNRKMVVASGRHKTKADQQHAITAGVEAVETNSAGTSTQQKSSRKLGKTSSETTELAPKNVATSESNGTDSEADKKLKKSPAGKESRLTTCILTRKQQRLGKKKATRINADNKAVIKDKKSHGSVENMGKSKTETNPIQTIVPIDDNKVKCMYCETIMSNITEITSHKCSKTVSDGCGSEMPTSSKGVQRTSQGASLKQFSKLGILGTVQMIRNEDSPCGGEDDIDVE